MTNGAEGNINHPGCKNDQGQHQRFIGKHKPTLNLYNGDGTAVRLDTIR
ncbi:hypothetical protein SDC9_63671 [bioreactor metagenome]|uniref:Uncharacterized protein n=1 Tax=bioreactor metagenome TaxID=1076179 RepID=A0A644XSN7_9ZZZZ